MKFSFQMRAFTLIDLLVVIAVLMILSILVYPGGAADKRKAMRISCVNNLKQISLAFRIYAGDNRNRFPMNISTNNQIRVDENMTVLEFFNRATNECRPFVFHCPADRQRNNAKDFTNFKSENISYFVGLDSDTSSPNSMLAGDRNITNGVAPKNNLLYLTTNQTVGFTDEIHKRQGNIALADGSVQQVSSARLRSEILANSPFATNRIKLP
jgi:prepilin-type processing-associated H-X9-DG protein